MVFKEEVLFVELIAPPFTILRLTVIVVKALPSNSTKIPLMTASNGKVNPKFVAFKYKGVPPSFELLAYTLLLLVALDGLVQDVSPTVASLTNVPGLFICEAISA